jgi:hypothetical protein
MAGRERRPTYLFTLRLWKEPTADQEQMEIRFKVQHVLSGEVRYFRAWTDVIAFILRHVQHLERDPWREKENPK